MGKKSYDSYSGMSHGGGKAGKGMPMATDTTTKGYVPGGGGWGSANVTGSRLNRGGDMKWKGKRSSHRTAGK